MDQLKFKRTGIKGSLTRFLNFLDSEDLNPHEIKKSLEKCEQLYDQYNAIQTEIEILFNDDEQQTELQAADRESFENNYFHAVSKAQNLLDETQLISAQTLNCTSQPTNETHIKLPDIRLPVFDGQLGNWLKFRDSFVSMIHENVNLDNVDKFNYLKGYVTGEAARTIEALGVSDVNYTIAWNKLKSRYEDSNALLNHHISNLYEIPKMTRNSSFELRKLIDDTTNHLLALEVLGEKIQYWDRMVIYLTSSKLHFSINKEWERILAGKAEMPTFKEMVRFLENHCKFLEKTVVDNYSHNEKTNSRFLNKNVPLRNNNIKSYAVTTINNKTCALCKGAHPLYACESFKRLSPPERITKVKELGLCFCCLASGHQNKNCSFGPCKKCGRKHNNLLHVEKTSTEVQAPTGSASPQLTCSALTTTNSASYVLLATANVLLYDKQGREHECRALLDSCSQPNIMTAALCKKLGLEQLKTNITLSGIDQGTRHVACKATTKLKSRINNFSTSITYIVIDKISDNLPSRHVRLNKVQIPAGIELADPQFNYSRPVDILIGASLFYQLMSVGQIKLSENQPIFQKTVLGWIVAGSINVAPEKGVVCNIIKNNELHKSLERFWEIEHCYGELQGLNKPDLIIKQFLKTVKRDESERFVVSIPFKDSISKLGNSRNLAYKRVTTIDRKFSKNLDLKLEYIKFMNAPEAKDKQLNLLIQRVNEEKDEEENNEVETTNFNIFNRFSSYSKLIRTTAYLIRFIKNCREAIKVRNISTNVTQNKNRARKELNKPLSSIELECATNYLVKLSQQQTFSKEILELEKFKKLSKTSNLLQLNPFLDESRLLRVGGRLKNASIPYDQRHQMILSAKHRFAHLLIESEHKRLLHAGCQTVLVSLRKRFWLLAAKNQIKKILRQCITCFRFNPKQSVYLMGDLPLSRITQMRAFYVCGVDYAGPFLIKEKLRSRVAIKAYICIFVCFSTKAVHIELVSDLTTNAFLNCLKRFISRRGICKTIYSDNGKNFVGARNELVELGHFLKSTTFQNNVREYASNINIDWHFIPPHAPHFGGLWESAVKSAKYHLKRVIGETRLTFEELYTLLTQVEACLNSRPLFPMSNDPNDLSTLTPGHFLIGDLLTALPQADLCDETTHKLNRYQHLQQMLQHFWKRWHLEYLPILQPRKKWTKSTELNLNPGDMVLVREDNTPPMQWPLGRIVNTHVGSDNVTRVVSVRVAKGTIKRPVSKIYKLPSKKETD
ncbi:uncharacterized protein LOC108742837 isoform X2 [Agrilus planipennis]|uniref:Uncharacterized protein LOC108742837 isoform X2 n=1 Tax=Agrilus planipennis TaxID=224129 RepID=A0A7F5RH08_AGRPL|nr:uncharacterized protein LOC108742837 isoform X2 [Agrilus planipennis]